MELLIFSDNHRDYHAVDEMLQKHPNVDHIISLGDSEMREFELTERNIYGVKGNYPFEPKFPRDLTMVFEGVKVYLTHGHLYSVKMGLSRLLNHGLYNDIDIICYGHTHRFQLAELQGIVFVNPGSLSRSRMFAKASYARMIIDARSIHIIIQTLDGEILEEYTKKR